MAAPGEGIEGGRIVAATAATVAAVCTLVVARYGTGAEGMHSLIRATARTSLVLFSAAFSAAALVRLELAYLLRLIAAGLLGQLP